MPNQQSKLVSEMHTKPNWQNGSRTFSNRHNNNLYNDTRHSNKNATYNITIFGIQSRYAERGIFYCYVESRYAKLSAAFFILMLSVIILTWAYCRNAECGDIDKMTEAGWWNYQNDILYNEDNSFVHMLVLALLSKQRWKGERKQLNAQYFLLAN